MILCTNALHLGHHTNKQLTLDNLTYFNLRVKFVSENRVCFEHYYICDMVLKLESGVRVSNVLTTHKHDQMIL